METDLYYADLYNGSWISYTWDDNNDSRYGDLQHDMVEGMPDIFVGRLPASTKSEARILVDKIINYEPPLQRPWGVFAGTDTFRRGYPEGEYLSEYMIEHYAFNNSTITRLYETAGNLTRGSFIQTINQGPSLVSFAGHGLPRALMLGMEEYTSSDALKQKNKQFQSLFMDLACLAARFADYDALGEELLLNRNGGGIGYLGSTRVAWGYLSQQVKQGLAGEMLGRLVNSYYSPLRNNLGSIWGKAISSFIRHNPLDRSFSTRRKAVYLNWKTVAERVLLGDPTLSLATQCYSENTTSSQNITISSGNTTYFSNELYIQKDSSIRIGGHLNLSDSYLELENASIFLNGGTLSLTNTTIYGGGSIVGNGSLRLENSRIIGADINLGGYSGEIKNSVVETLKIAYGFSSNLTVVNSSIGFMIRLSNRTIKCSVKDKLYDTFDFSQLFGANITVKESYLTFSFSGKNITLTLTKSSVEKLKVTESNITINQSTLGEVSAQATSLSIHNSSLLLNLTLTHDAEIHSLAENDSLTLNRTEIALSNSSISWGLTVTQNATLRLNDSVISFLSLSTGKAICRNVTFNYITNNCANATVNLIASQGMILSSQGTIISRHSDIYGTYIAGKFQSEHSTYELVKFEGEDASGSMTDSHITQLNILEGTINLTAAEVTYTTLRNKGNLVVSNSTLAVLDCSDNSSAVIRHSEVFYWLRCFENASITIQQSKVWLALSYRGKNRIYNLTNLTTGNVTHLHLEANWVIDIRSSFLYGLDVLSYNANLTLIGSDVSKVFCFYESTISIRRSHVQLLRGTHTSTLEVRKSNIGKAYMSGRAHLICKKAQIGTMYAIDHSQAHISYTTLDICVGFGHPQIFLTHIQGGIVAPFLSSNFSILNSDIILYLSFEGKDITLTDYKPTYTSRWTNQNLGVTTSWNVTVNDSKLQWLFDLTNCQATIKHSKLYSLYLTGSNATIHDVKITKFFASFISHLNATNLEVAYISYFLQTTGEIEKSFLVPLLYIRSTITMYDSIVLPYLMISGNASFRLQPGYFANRKLSEFGDAPQDLSLHLVKTSVIAWGVIAYQGGNVTLQDSNLIGAEIAGSSHLSLMNSRVSGYLSVFYPEKDTSVTVQDSTFKLSLWIYNTKLTVNQFQKVNHGLTWRPISSVKINNSTIFGLDVHAVSSTIYIVNSMIGTVNTRYSYVKIVSSKVETTTLKHSHCVVNASNVGTLEARYSSLAILSSSINKLSPTYSQLRISHSQIGVAINLLFRSRSFTDIHPETIEEKTWKIARSSLLLRDVKITSYSFSITNAAKITLSHSNVSKIVIKGFGTAQIKHSTIQTMKLSGQARVTAKDCTLGLLLTYQIVQRTLQLSKHASLQISEGKGEVKDMGWSLAINQSRIQEINVTATNANLTLTSGKINFYRGMSFSTLSVTGARISRAAIYHAQLEAKNARLRIVAALYHSVVHLENSKCGLTAIFWNQDGSRALPSGSSFSWQNRRLGVEVQVEACKVYDWSVAVMGDSTLTMNKTHLLRAVAYQLSNLTLRNPVLEEPPIARGLGKITVLRTLEIQVKYDFRNPDSATIAIKRNTHTISKVRAENGHYSTLLPQAVITAQKRKDLGEYKIKASVGRFSATKTIYLHERTSVRVWILGPVSWALIGSLAVVVALGGYLGYRHLKKESQEKESKSKSYMK